ncbi:MAG: type II secretion system F family protein [Clostridia bacterium]|nr:type II secretion system F family protein [Clostridia bacterium]
MITYKYQAISRGGEKVSGVVEAFNEFDAVERIKQNCDIVVKINEVSKARGFFNMDVGKPKLNGKAFTVMCSQFAIILRAGVPIARTVHLIADKTSDKYLKKILGEVAEDVEAGRSISSSFAERGEEILPPIFIETIRAGEESGSLANAFETMYQHYDKQMKMAGKVRAALIYPIFVLIIAVVVVIVLMAKVVPTFTAIFESYGAELPGITRALIAISTFFQKYWIIMLAVIAVLIIGYKIASNTEKGRLKLSQWQLKLPVLGNISILGCASQFANSMTTLIGAGLPLVRCINITAKVIENYYVSQEVGKIAGKIEEGRALGETVRESGVMPDILTDMTAVGEETGELQETLDTIAKYYDTELELAINAALAKLEPILLITLGVIAGFIVIAIYVAMFEMYNAM